MKTSVSNAVQRRSPPHAQGRPAVRAVAAVPVAVRLGLAGSLCFLGCVRYPRLRELSDGGSPHTPLAGALASAQLCRHVQLPGSPGYVFRTSMASAAILPQATPSPPKTPNSGASRKGSASQLAESVLKAGRHLQEPPLPCPSEIGTLRERTSPGVQCVPSAGAGRGFESWLGN